MVSLVKLLLEDKVSDTIKKLIKANSLFSQEELSTPVSNLDTNIQKQLKSSNETIYNACISNSQNLLAYLRLYFLSYFDLNHGKGPQEYVFGLARIAISELGMFKSSNSDSELSKLKQVVLFLHNSDNQELKDSYNEDLNGLDYQSLVSELDKVRKEFNIKNRDRLANIQTNSNKKYKVIAINSYEEASKYGKYTTWCVTHGNSHYDSYTKGGRRFYFCLEEGFENITKKVTEGCPLDTYGLSMISILVDMDGEPNYITTRWNHEHDGENNENLRTAEQLQAITGINFYNTFKPYSREELHKIGIVLFDEVEDLLKSGKKPKEVFDFVDNFSEGYAAVKLNGKYNFIDKQGNLLSKQWFDWTGDFHEGYAIVELNDKFNFIDKQGNFLFRQWFDWTGDFHEGFATVKLNDKFNFIDKQGNFLLKQWLNFAYGFHEGYAKVELNGKWNFIDKQGNLYDKDKKPIKQPNNLQESFLGTGYSKIIEEYLV